MYRNQIELRGDKILLYNELPLKMGDRKPCHGEVNGVPCVIFRKRCMATALNYLMRKCPELDGIDYLMKFCVNDPCMKSKKYYAPEIISRFEEHDMAYYFTAETDKGPIELLAVLEGELWKGAGSEFSYLIRLVQYCHDYEESDGNAFMSDYGLC